MANHTNDSGFFSATGESFHSHASLFGCPWEPSLESQDANHSSSMDTGGDCDESLPAECSPLLPWVTAAGPAHDLVAGPPHPALDELRRVRDGEPCDSVAASKRKNLKQRLLAAKTQSALCEGRWFIPFGEIASILTAGQMSQCLWPAMDESETQQVHGFLVSMRKVFGILALMEKLDFFSIISNAGVVDAVLPLGMGPPPTPQLFDLITAASLWSESGPSPWSDGDTCQFLELQWTFLAPLFTLPSPGGVGRTMRFDAKTILPFVKADEGEDIERRGGSSIVRRVHIHESHYNFENLPMPKWFAIKTLSSARAEEYYIRETTTLQQLDNCPDSHIVQLLAAFRHGDSFHLLFPWAEGDLAALWRRNPSPPHDAGFARWVAAQVLGLTRALVDIHHGPARSSDVDPQGTHARKIQWHHGDLKPENILCFETGHEPLGRLKIADFGLACNHHRVSGLTPSYSHFGGHTLAYRPPEFDICDLTRPPEPATDLWSFGCVLLELVTWSLLGNSGLDRLASARAPAGRGGRCDPAFFERVTSGINVTAEHSVTHRLKPGVADIIEELRRESFLHLWDELICLIDRHLLVCEQPNDSVPKKRITALQLAERLNLLYTYFNSSLELAGWMPRHPKGVITAAPPRGMFCQDHTFHISPRYRTSTSRGALAGPSLPNSQDPDGAAARRPALSLSTSQSRPGNLISEPLANSANKRKSKIATHARGRARQTRRRGARPLFACPFFQINPTFFREFSSGCSGPGFENFHRVKEHIQRRHMPNPYVCERCGENCESDSGLHNHRIMEERCEVVKRAPAQGVLTPEAAINFKGRRQWGKDFPEEQKWRIIFHEIFPDHPMPSPYYDHEASTSSKVQSENTIPETTANTAMDTAVGSLCSVVTCDRISAQVADYVESLRRRLPAQEEHDLGLKLGRDLGVDPEKYSLLAQRFRYKQLKDLELALRIPVSEPPPEVEHGPGQASGQFGSSSASTWPADSSFPVSGLNPSSTSHRPDPFSFEPLTLEFNGPALGSAPLNDDFSAENTGPQIEAGDEM